MYDSLKINNVIENSAFGFYLFIKFQFNDYYKIYEIITAALAISRALGPFGKLFISMSCFLVSSISIILFPVS